MANRLCENLIILMERHRIGAVQLARVTGIPLSTIKNIRKQANTNPTLGTLIPLARCFSVTLEELVEGNETSLVKNELSCHLPVIFWEEVIKIPGNRQVNEAIYTEKACSEHAFAVRFEHEDIGSFSAPGILLVDPALVWQHLDHVLVHNTETSEIYVKQLICDEEQFYLKSLLTNKLRVMNQRYRMIGTIIEYRKHLRRMK